MTNRYDRITRFLGASWFLFVASNVAVAAYHEPEILAFVAKLCVVIFDLMLGLLLLTRPAATSQIRGFIPRLAAFAGTYMPWAIALFPRSVSTPSVSLLSMVCLIAGTFLAIITVSFLGRSFSIIPQARKVVRGGPYRWLRHPLYAAEEIAVFGTLLQFLSPITVAIFLIHVGIQICRIMYEERLLRATFPEYNLYATTSWRLLPYVW